jgi:hypothetical protein
LAESPSRHPNPLKLSLHFVPEKKSRHYEGETPHDHRWDLGAYYLFGKGPLNHFWRETKKRETSETTKNNASKSKAKFLTPLEAGMNDKKKPRKLNTHDRRWRETKTYSKQFYPAREGSFTYDLQARGNCRLEKVGEWQPGEGHSIGLSHKQIHSVTYPNPEATASLVLKREAGAPGNVVYYDETQAAHLITDAGNVPLQKLSLGQTISRLLETAFRVSEETDKPLWNKGTQISRLSCPLKKQKKCP